MPDPSQVPVWIQTAETGVATAVGLWGAVVGQRQRGLQVFPRLLEEASALGPDEIARVVEANPSVAELAGRHGSRRREPPTRTSEGCWPRSPPGLWTNLIPL